tara:strand:+ start:1228 stop:1506 length:279 start_codon:yes stop_codon:yes gene_type:complete
MILPPVTPDYKSSSQAILNEVLTKADEQNFKLDRDNFFTTGSICLQSDNGKWWQITISDSGVLGTSELTTSDGRLDSDGNPVIASVNPYYTS